MKKIWKWMTCLALFLCLTACGNQTTKDQGSPSEGKPSTEASEENVFRVGCEATTPGWIQTDEKGNLQGYDYDVWMEIGKRTGYKVDYQIMDWDGMWAMLDSGRLDSVGEQISTTEEREKKYVFTEPYAYNLYCLLSRADNENLQTMDDLKTGMTISCESNTSDEKIVEAINKEYNIELKPVFYDGMSLQDVALGRCDLWPRAETSCLLTVKEVDNLKILGKTGILETNAYPFTKSDRGEKLAKLANQALQEMREDGTLQKLSEKWFGIDITKEPEGVDTEL